MKPYEGLKSWLLLFSLNGFTHELIGPQTSNILLMTGGQATRQKMLKFSIIDPKIFLH